jgi:type I site-specific restriction endonuclease
LQLEKKLSELSFSYVSCIGGEAKFMANKLKLMPAPDFIISTTVLSHGVNLPQIAKVYFLYKVNNLDFWLQMVARGGRRGERFEVIALEKPYNLPWNHWRNFLKVFWMSNKRKFYPLINFIRKT